MNSLSDSARPWIAGPNVVGTGASFKTTAGRRTRDYALRVYVRAKLPDDDIPLAQRVPAVVHLGAAGVVPTDVVEIGEVELESAAGKTVEAGQSIGSLNGETGTIACIVAKIADPATPLILSNSHILADSGIARVGHSVIVPGGDDGGTSASVVGRLIESVPFDFSDNYNNFCDAALASIDRDIKLSNTVQGIGPILEPNAEPRLAVGAKVQKTGRTSKHTTGVIEDVHFRTSMFYPNVSGGFGTALFRDQVLCSKYTESGDSGALICDCSGRAVGLHWAGTGRASIFTPIQLVFARLAIQLWRGPG
jgi:hypothetical protein